MQTAVRSDLLLRAPNGMTMRTKKNTAVSIEHYRVTLSISCLLPTAYCLLFRPCVN
jgi:hypothetical protein